MAVDDVFFLPVYVGYLVVLGFGGLLAVITAGLVHLVSSVDGKTQATAEGFSTADRNVKTGLMGMYSPTDSAATRGRMQRVARQ
jgi:hypothetical protein